MNWPNPAAARRASWTVERRAFAAASSRSVETAYASVSTSGSASASARNTRCCRIENVGSDGRRSARERGAATHVSSSGGRLRETLASALLRQPWVGARAESIYAQEVSAGPLRRPDLSELETFLLAVREGSLAKAARTLHISKTAAAKRVATLEALVGHALLVRGPRGVTLTDRGRALVPQVEHLLVESERLYDFLRTFRAGDDGLRISGVRSLLGLAPPSTERLLSDTESLFATIFHSVSEGIAIARPADGRIDEANDAFCRTFGYAREEMLGRTGTEIGLITPENRETLIGPLLASGSIEDVQVEIVRKDGEQRHVRVSAVLVTIGGSERILAAGSDVTEHVRYERRLAKQASQQRAVAELTLAALENEPLASLCDRSAQLLAGDLDADAASVWELVGDGDALDLRSSRLGAGGLAAVPRVRFDDRCVAAVMKDGVVVAPDLTRDARFEGTPLARLGARSVVLVRIGDEEAACGLLAAFARDRNHFDGSDVDFVRAVANTLALVVSREHNLDEQASRARQLANFTLLVEASNDPIGLSSIEGPVAYLNPAARTLLGVAADAEVETLTMTDLLDPRSAKRLDEEIIPALRRDRRWEGALSTRRLDTGAVVAIRARAFIVADPASGEPRYIAAVLRAAGLPTRRRPAGAA